MSSKPGAGHLDDSAHKLPPKKREAELKKAPDVPGLLVRNKGEASET